MKHAFTLVELLVVVAIVAILATILFPVFAQAKAAAKRTVCLSSEHAVGLASMMYAGDHDDAYAMNRFPDPERGVAGCGDDWTLSRDDWRHEIVPYLRTMDLLTCPTNARAWSVGDAANAAYPAAQRAPLSYAYGGYFNETWFTCRNGAPRPRLTTEPQDPAGLIFLAESNLSNPDVGHWALGDVTKGGLDVFPTHVGKTMTWTFADGHTKAMRLARTVAPRQMWTDDPADQAGVETYFRNGAAKNPNY